MAEHLRTAFKKNYKGYGRLFYQDIRRHGRDAYLFSVITKTYSPDMAKRLENKFIDVYKQEGLSLNTTYSCGVHDSEARKNRSKSLKGNKNGCGQRSLTSRIRISEGMTKNKSHA